MVAVPLYIPTSRAQEFHFLPSHQQLLLCFLIIVAILMGVWWYFTVVLIYISLMIGVAEHLKAGKKRMVYILQVMEGLVPQVKGEKTC